MTEQRYHGWDRLIAAKLKGDRSLFQQDHLRPRCPWCSTRLRPGRVLGGWDPGARRTTSHCLTCEGSWAEVDDPGELVDAYAAYWIAGQPGEGQQPYAAFTEQRLRDLRVEVPSI